MSVVLSFFKGVWKYRVHIILMSKLAREIWRTAQDLTREYIKTMVRKRLRRQIVIIAIEIAVLLLAYFLDRELATLGTRLFASIVLWGVTAYNLIDLTAVTIPELRQVHRLIKGRVGYTLKYFLQISLVTELLEWHIAFLAACCFLAFTSRTMIAATFDFVAPWVELFRLL